MAKTQAKVKWTAYYDNLKECLIKIYENNHNYDVKLVSSDGKFLDAHQIVLMMSSDFFVDILKDFPAHLPPVIIIPDMKHEILEQVVSFMYRGEVQLLSNQLSDFLESFSLFQFKGLEYNNGRFSGVSLTVNNPTVEFELIEEEEDDEELIEQGNKIVYQAENLPTKDFEVEPDVVAQEIEMIEDNEFYECELVNENNTICETITKESLSSESTPRKSKRAKTFDYGSKLETAVNAILAGKSFRNVSQEFNIPKTVLWRRVSKLSVYQKVKPELPIMRKKAIEEMKDGQTLLSISEKYNIPLSTLHRDKMRLYNQGNLPDSVALKNRDKNFKKRVLEAANSCLKGAMTQSDAAKAFNLPKTTIWRKLKQLKEKVDCTENSVDIREDDRTNLEGAERSSNT